MQRKRRIETQVATFRVTYPWGETYTNRLRRALPRLGVRTMRDPFVDGSDNGGFFIGPDGESMSQARRLIRDYIKELDDELDDDDNRAWIKLLEALGKLRVFEVIHDWKHFGAGEDQLNLVDLGVALTVVDRPRDREGYEVFECTLRPLSRSRKRRGSRQSQRGKNR